jgi:mono/diheme cytochrome c family protein
VPSVTVTYPTLDAAQVAQGREVYRQHCAVCHGPSAEGAPNWRVPGPDGFYPPPPHDDTGHTWHHPDRVLYEAIHDGLRDPLKPDSPLRMPAWGDKLREDEIRAVIEYFKSLWTVEHRQYQWERTQDDQASHTLPPVGSETPAP